ncbi:cytochrome b-c1 complex subunit 7-like isoform X1 [Panicum virgatum]|uniref:cytochrome b-c1 complex subunit 7-like isoform X1 n=1 Tax=Panicum virgatum TaxID=38727 RepID=UPI0019D5A92D|nr:cytochrome b-c1 complex subunit 7-like isoform X1 [Panicum virgatum]
MSSMMSVLSNWLVNPRRNPLARLHMHAVSSRLRKYGLRYDDLYDPYFDLDIKEALGRLPKEVVDARVQRLKRAMDLSMKHQYLPEDLQAAQTPFRGYLSDMLALVRIFSASSFIISPVLSIKSCKPLSLFFHKGIVSRAMIKFI